MPLNATLFLLVGLPASGKTTEARRLERAERALRLSSDEWMLPLFGPDDADTNRNVVEGQLIQIGFQAVQRGLNVVLDLGLWARDERSALVWIADQLGAKSQLIYLPIDPTTQLARAQKRVAGDTGNVYPVSAKRFEGFLNYFQPPDAEELSGRARYSPPPGWSGWSEWATGRWPTLPHLEELRVN